jgi:hypothetical protein
MDKYITLLTQASNKADYRKRPIDTLKKVQQLANKSAKNREDEVAKRKIKYNESTPTRLAISDAIKKSGRKAFKEMTQAPNKKLNDLLYQKRTLELENAPPSAIERINKDIDKLIGKQIEQEKLEKSLEKYKDRPEIYLAKLQEAKQAKETEQTEEQLETSRQLLASQAETARLIDEQTRRIDEQTRQLLITQGETARKLEILKDLPPALTDVKNLLQLQLKPAQLLELDENYRKLKPKEKKYLLGYLQKSTPRDTSKRATIVKTYLSSTDVDRKKVLQEIVSQLPEEKAEITDVLQDKEIKKEKKRYLNMTRYDSREMKKYVSDKLYGDIDAVDALSIQDAIIKYKLEFEESQPAKTDILVEEADDAEADREETIENVEKAIDKSGKKEAVEDITREDADDILEDEDEPIVKGLKEQLVKDGSEEADADDDAREVVAKTKAELSKAGEDEDEGEYEDEEPKIVFPGITTINKMTVGQIEKFTTDNNITLPKSAKTGKGSLTRARNFLINLRSKQPSGKGFKPLSSHPQHLIAGSMAKHINNVIQKRFITNLNKLKVFKNTDNEEYRKGLKQHLLSGGSLMSWLGVNR